MTHPVQGASDVAVVGAGILGLAHAYFAARAGKSVRVFERSPRPLGASIRNFGMIWPIGQPPGRMWNLANRSREIWAELVRDSGCWHSQSGSLHLAYREDEWDVLQEFHTLASGCGVPCDLLSSRQVVQRSEAVVENGLIGALWSPAELNVDSPEVLNRLPAFLAERHGVHFEWNTPVSAIDLPRLETARGHWETGQVIIAAGDDIHTLYPDVFRSLGLRRCKLQMMSTLSQPAGWKLGPMLAGGLTLRHYRAFEKCPSLPRLRERVSIETPEFDEFGIHVMVSQRGSGELVLGDSHEYGVDADLFDNPRIDEFILEYLGTFLRAPESRIGRRWHGFYLKHPDLPYVTAAPQPGVFAITGAGGAGMTLSFGLAEETCARLFG